MFIEGTDNPMVAKYGPGGLNQPNAQSICPIHIAVENADKVSLSGLLMVVQLLPVYCKRGNFRVGVIFAFFALLSSSRKLPPRENKTHMPL